MAEHPGTMLRQMVEETQAELADMLGLSRFTINQLMRGRRTLTPNVALRLENIGYGKAREWLMMQLEFDLERERRLMDRRVP